VNRSEATVNSPAGSHSSDARQIGPQSICLFLSLAFRQDNLAEARRSLLAHWPETTVTAAAARLEPALATAVRQAGVLQGIPVLRSPNPRVTPAAWVEHVWADHLSRRTALTEHLENVVRILNAKGLVPLLLKGARSLWVGSPDWRSMRDLDLLVAPSAAGIAQAALMAEGYREGPEGLHEPSFYHANNLYRSDLPGWIEIHRRAGPERAELLVPTEDLLAAAVTIQRSQLRALILPPSYDLLHGLVHHHFGHREGRTGVLDLKGLFEFAMGFAALSKADRELLAERAGWNNRLLATLELWLAAAADLFSATDIWPFVPQSDAVARWTRIKDGTGRPSKLAALQEELRLALADDRLRRCRHGDRLLGRMRLRAQTVVWAATSFGSYQY
jgi:Uncharacterised nucleotidyltransferase